MGLTYADIEIFNGIESAMARKDLFDKDEVKRTWVNVLVDSGALLLTINENIQEILQLPVVGTKNAELADGGIETYDVVAPVEVRFGNRQTFCEALVLPGGTEPLLGAIPMEGMDVIIDPRRQVLIPHPEHSLTPLVKLK